MFVSYPDVRFLRVSGASGPSGALLEVVLSDCCGLVWFCGPGVL